MTLFNVVRKMINAFKKLGKRTNVFLEELSMRTVEASEELTPAPKVLYSFDLVGAIEKSYGIKVDAASVMENVKKLTVKINYYGFGSGSMISPRERKAMAKRKVVNIRKMRSQARNLKHWKGKH